MHTCMYCARGEIPDSMLVYSKGWHLGKIGNFSRGNCVLYSTYSSTVNWEGGTSNWEGGASTWEGGASTWEGGASTCEGGVQAVREGL